MKAAGNTVEDVGAPVRVEQEAGGVGLLGRRQRIDFNAAQHPLLHRDARQGLGWVGR